MSFDGVSVSKTRTREGPDIQVDNTNFLGDQNFDKLSHSSPNQTKLGKSSSKLKDAKVGLKTTFDFQRMEHLLKLIQNVISAKTLHEAFNPIMQTAGEVINCSGCCIFVLQKKILKGYDQRQMKVQQTIVEGRYIDVACSDDKLVQLPVFNKIQDANYPIYTKSFMSWPIFDDRQNFIATMQFESKARILQEKKDKKHSQERI